MSFLSWEGVQQVDANVIKVVGLLSCLSWLNVHLLISDLDLKVVNSSPTIWTWSLL